MIIVLITLIQNAALLLAMMVVFDLVTSWKPVHSQWGRQVPAGVLLGGLCLGLMLASFQLETGIVFDTRSVLLSLSGLFLGPIPTVIAMAMATIYHISLGGTGIWTGTGVILATGGIGILWRHYRPGRLADITLRELYGFGVVVHLVMLAMMLTLPREAALRVLGGIGLPVLLVYPITTIALGWLLAARLKREYATNAMAKSEDRYRSLFEAVNVGTSVTQPTGEIEVNQAFCDMLGYTLEDLRGKTWQELTPPEDIGPINERLAPLMRGERYTIRFEKRYIHKNNSYVWADVSATKLGDRDGKLLAFMVTAVDITDRKRGFESLRQSENRFKRALDNIPDVVVIYDKDLRIQYINAATQRVAGRPVSDFIGKREEEVWPPEVYQVYMPILLESRNTGELQSLDAELTIPNNGIRSLKITCVPLLDDKGAVREIVGITNDYTERKQTGEKMAEQMRELQRWHAVMLDREDRVIELKREVNALLAQTGQTPRYQSTESHQD